MSYKIIPLDLTVASSDPAQIVPQNQAITEIVLLKMPAGASFQLAIGDGPMIEIEGPISFQPTGVEETTRGLYWQNPVAQPGVVLSLLVAFGASTGAASVA